MMGGMGLIMLLGLITFAAFVIVIVRASGSLQVKSKRKNDELLPDDEAYFVDDDGEIVEYSEKKFRRNLDFSDDNRTNLP